MILYETKGGILLLSYNPLWHTLIDRNLKKLELCKIADISTATLAKLGKNETVTTETLDKICSALNCRIEEVIEFVPNAANNKEK